MHPLTFKFFLLTRLPSAFFAGVRVKDADAERCIVTVPYKWFTKNPFRSTYFACLSMAAEMSTGILVMTHIRGMEKSLSCLVVKLEANYFKKAVGRSYFQCTDGALIRKSVEQAFATGEGTTVRACSLGTNEAGEVIAKFFITWSFKLRKSI
ncbi:MAG TPA: DUF4442 domain-containing protein [Puia sp.]